jgi:hypothetical protein
MDLKRHRRPNDATIGGRDQAPQKYKQVPPNYRRHNQRRGARTIDTALEARMDLKRHRRPNDATIKGRDQASHKSTGAAELSRLVSGLSDGSIG